MMYIPGDEPDIGGPCPVSHYCPVGTSTPYACPAGTYNNITGQYECTPCPAGYFCNENTTTYEDFPCPVGHYCPNGTKYHDEFPCPNGTFRASQQGHSDSDCTQCTGGSYCRTEGLKAPTALCDAGMYFFSFVFNELSKIELLTKNVC
jgi:hypothetical protein